MKNSSKYDMSKRASDGGPSYSSKPISKRLVRKKFRPFSCKFLKLQKQIEGTQQFP